MLRPAAMCPRRFGRHRRASASARKAMRVLMQHQPVPLLHRPARLLHRPRYDMVTYSCALLSAHVATWCAPPSQWHGMDRVRAHIAPGCNAAPHVATQRPMLQRSAATQRPMLQRMHRASCMVACRNRTRWNGVALRSVRMQRPRAGYPTSYRSACNGGRCTSSTRHASAHRARLPSRPCAPRAASQPVPRVVSAPSREHCEGAMG